MTRHVELFVAIIMIVFSGNLHASDCLEEIGIWPYGPAMAVATADDGLIFSHSGRQLMIMQFAEPDALTLIAESPLPNTSYDMLWSDGTLFSVHGARGLSITDVHDPEHPRRLSTKAIHGIARSVVKKDSMLWIAAERGGVVGLDISNLNAPQFVDSVAPALISKEIAMQDQILWVGTNDGLHAVDTTDPNHPAELGFVAVSGDILDIAVGDSQAFVATDWGGVFVVDISDVHNPRIAGNYFQWARSATGVMVRDHLAYVSYGAYLQTLDVADPDDILEVGFLFTGGPSGGALASADLGHVVIADRANGVAVVEVADPAQPALAASFDMPGYLSAISAMGDLIYLGTDGDREGGFRTLDVVDPQYPELLGRSNGPEYTNFEEIVVVGDHAYASDSLDGIHVFDVSNPLSPRYVTTYELIGGCQGIAESDGRLAVISQGSGLLVFDLSQPENPLQIATLELTEYAEDLAIDDHGVAFLTGWGLGLLTVDLVDPYHPLVLAELSGIRGRSIDVYDGIVFVAADHQGLRIFDVSDPAQTAEIGGLDPGTAIEVVVSDKRAYLSTWKQDDCPYEMLVFDVSHPDHPVRVDSYCTFMPRMSHFGNRVLLADRLAGFVILDGSMCSRPRMPEGVPLEMSVFD